MNPYSLQQKFAKQIVQNAFDWCRLEKENTEFLIQVKETLIGISRRGIEALSEEFFDAALVLADGEIIIPSPRSILEHETLHHVNSMHRQQVLLEGINEALASLDNPLRQHNKSYDYKFQRFVNRRRTNQSKNNSASSSLNV